MVPPCVGMSVCRWNVIHTWEDSSLLLVHICMHCIAGSLGEGGCCVGSVLRTEEFIGAATLDAHLLNFCID